jgi:hypothetical protein
MHRMRPASALAALAALASLAAATNYTCPLEMRTCTYELQAGDYVGLYTGFQAQSWSIESGRVYLRFTDSYGNYLANLELRPGQNATAQGALAFAHLSGIRALNATHFAANLTLRALLPNLKLVADLRPESDWPVLTQGMAIQVRDYVNGLRVVNDGETSVGSFRFSFVLEQDGETVGYPIDREIPDPAPGETVNITFFRDILWSTGILPRPLPADFQIRLIVDRLNFTVETDEGDNEVRLNVTLRPRDGATPTPAPTLAPIATPVLTPVPFVATPEPVPAAPAPAPPAPRDGTAVYALVALVVIGIVAWVLTRPRGPPRRALPAPPAAPFKPAPAKPLPVRPAPRPAPRTAAKPPARGRRPSYPGR